MHHVRRRTNTPHTSRLRRLAALLIALPVAASFVVAQPTTVEATASPRGCDRWTSLSRPPDTIRVLRTRSNNVTTVSFRRYVLIVMAKEWPSYLPQSVVEAGAVAVKQFAWYHTLYTTRSSRGGCFDVKDGSGDQIFRPRNNRPSSDHYRAVDATWTTSLRKRGNFFMTAYRRGAKVRCGRDSNGNRLYAISAKHCAERHGYGWRQILREYYGNISFVEGGGSAAATRAVQAPAQVPTPGSSAVNSPTSNPIDQPAAPATNEMPDTAWTSPASTSPASPGDARTGVIPVIPPGKLAVDPASDPTWPDVAGVASPHRVHPAADPPAVPADTVTSDAAPPDVAAAVVQPGIQPVFDFRIALAAAVTVAIASAAFVINRRRAFVP